MMRPLAPLALWLFSKHSSPLWSHLEISWRLPFRNGRKETDGATSLHLPVFLSPLSLGMLGCRGIKSESLSPWAFCEGSDRLFFQCMPNRWVIHLPSLEHSSEWLHSYNKISAPMLTLCHFALLMRHNEEDTLPPFHLAASAFSSPSTFLSLCHHFSLPHPQTSRAEASSRSSSRGRGREMRRWSSMLECEMCDEISASYTVLWRTGNYPNPTCFFTGSIPKALCLGFLASESISCYHPHVLCWE